MSLLVTGRAATWRRLSFVQKRADIVEEIVNNLLPLRKTLSPKNVAAEIEQHIKLLSMVIAKLEKLTSASATRGAATELSSALCKLIGSLRNVPSELDYLLFWQAASEEDAVTPRRQLLLMLEGILRASEKIAEGVEGPSANYDFMKRNCATFAAILMRQFSTQPITSVLESRFRRIASLLYSALAGGQEPDLKRACDAELRSWRDLPASGPTQTFTSHLRRRRPHVSGRKATSVGNPLNASHH